MAVEVKRITELGNPKPVGNGFICVEYSNLRVQFSSPRGFGEERYAAVIEPDQFAYLARAMMKANSTEAIKAFGEALRRGIPEPVDPMHRWSPQWEDEKAT
jgi:hypothetical protein